MPAREHLFHAGDRNCDFYVVLSGTVAVIEADSMAGNRVISVHGPGRFLGELGSLTGEAAYYGAVALAEAAVLAVPVDRLRELVARDPVLGDLILRAYLIRRSLLVGLGVGLRIIGSRYSPDTRRLRDFAARNRLPAQWLDLEDDLDAESLLKQLGSRPEDTPIVILYGQRVLRNPGNAELAAAIGLPAPTRRHATCELLVVGAGPAGLSAAGVRGLRWPADTGHRGLPAAARQEPHRASRTTSASLPAYRGTSSPSGPCCKRRSSAHSSPSRPRPLAPS